MNYKNILQEYCQKNKLELPIYTSKASNNSHNPIWTANVFINNKIFNSGEFSTRKSAEQHAAELAYNHFIQPIQKPIQQQPIQQPEYNLFDLFDTNTDVNTNTDTKQDVFHVKKYKCPNAIIAVDLENIQPDFVYEVDADIHYFKSSYSTVSHEKYNGKIHIIDCSHSDAADHYMTFIMARLTSVKTNQKIIIASRDKSSGILAHILNNEGYNVIHVKTSNDLIDQFQLV